MYLREVFPEIKLKVRYINPLTLFITQENHRNLLIVSVINHFYNYSNETNVFYLP